MTAAWLYLFCSIGPILFSSHWPVLVSKTRQEERGSNKDTLLSQPPQVAIIGRSPAVRKVVWPDLLPGREGGEQLLVVGNTSVDERAELKELPSVPPVRRSKFASLGEPEDCQLSQLIELKSAKA